MTCTYKMKGEEMQYLFISINIVWPFIQLFIVLNMNISTKKETKSVEENIKTKDF